MSRSNGSVLCDFRHRQAELNDRREVVWSEGTRCDESARLSFGVHGWTLGEFSDYCPTHSRMR